MILQIGIIGIIGTLLAIQLQKTNKEYTLLIAIAIAIFVFIAILSELEKIVETAREIQTIMNMDIQYIQTILKMLGITYISEISAGICKDSGYGNIATQIELFGKISILALSMPILRTLLDTVQLFLS